MYKWSGKRNIVTFLQDSEPTSPTFGDIWYSITTKIMKCWVASEEGNNAPHWRNLISIQEN